MKHVELKSYSFVDNRKNSVVKCSTTTPPQVNIGKYNDVLKAGNIVLYNNQSDKFLSVKNCDYTLFGYPKEQYTPIGILMFSKELKSKINSVAEHDLFDDSTKDTIMALQYLDPNNIGNGYIITEKDKRQVTDGAGNYADCYVGPQMPFGFFGIDIDELSNKETGMKIYSSNDSSATASVGFNDFFPVSWDGYDVSEPCWKNRLLRYVNATNSHNVRKGIPLFDKDINVVPEYFEQGRILSSTDFSGKYNTDAFMAHCTLDNWNTIDVIQESTGNESYSIPCILAKRYSTVGTNQGDWYVPSFGQMSMLYYVKDIVDYSIKKINNVYKEIIASMVSTNYYILTSSPWGNTNIAVWADCAIPNTQSEIGYLFGTGRTGKRPCVAFCDISIDN